MIFGSAAANTEDDVWLPDSRVNLLRTSNTTDNYSIFETEHDTISARGKYTGDRVRKMYIDKADSDVSGSYSMKGHEDGTYEASITTVPEKGVHKLTLQLESTALMRYTIFYDEQNGWYFPTNEYSRNNRRVFDHIYEAPSEAAALYLSPGADPAEISTALEQISSLAEQVTAGAENDYDKAKAISRFVSEKLYYDLDARDTDVSIETIALCNVLKTGKTVCAGFTNLFCAMAESVGIDAVNIKGGITNNDKRYEELFEGKQNHEWAAFYFKEQERWVWVDACWDGSGTYKNGSFTESRPKYMYFDISDEAFSLNHRADKAERRHYFDAKISTEPLGIQTEADGEGSPVITSESTGGETADGTAPAEEMTPAPNGEADTTTETAGSEQSDAVYIAAIVALSAAVIAVGTVLIVIIVKGRKQ